TSAMASRAAGLTWSPGIEPAERTSTRSPARWRRNPAAIWERPALWTQTKSTDASGAVVISSSLPARGQPRLVLAASDVTVSVHGDVSRYWSDPGSGGSPRAPDRDPARPRDPPRHPPRRGDGRQADQPLQPPARAARGRCGGDGALRSLHVLPPEAGRHRPAGLPVRRPGRIRPYRCREQEGLSVTPTQAPSQAADSSVVAKLSTLDRFLAVWILLAMGLGLGLGRLIPGLNDALAEVEIGGISLPIAVGLLIMMYPVLAKVRYDRLDAVTGDRRLMASSLVINWIVGPAVMFALAWIFLPDLPE